MVNVSLSMLLYLGSLWLRILLKNAIGHNDVLLGTSSHGNCKHPWPIEVLPLVLHLIHSFLSIGVLFHCRPLCTYHSLVITFTFSYRSGTCCSMSILGNISLVVVPPIHTGLINT